MVRQRRMVIGRRLPLALVLLGIAGSARAAAPAAPIDGSPYRIEAHVLVETDARIDARGLNRLLAEWRSMVERFVGAPWDLSLAKETGTIGATPLDLLTPADLEATAADRDKVWVIRIQEEGSGFVLRGREYDVASRRLGPIRHQSAPVVDDLPREFLRFSLELFSPIAEVGETSGGGVMLRVRGASLESSSPVGRVVAPGRIFEPLRVVPQRDGSVRILKIPYSYLRAEAVEGSEVRCAIVSALRDPLTRRMASKNSLMALGIKPGDLPTRLRFVTRPENRPAAGYVLTVRPVPDGSPREVGTTDREGRIRLEPGFASGLVIFRLVAGNVEPMVELPLMPGESAQERTIPFDPKPATVTLETQLDSLRDAVIDLVAIRARLEARLKARADGEDWDGIASTLKEFEHLPSRDKFATRLTKLKEDAARQQALTKTAILTKTAQAQVAEVQALIDRYLDDEIVRGYTDALQAHNDEIGKAQSRATARKKQEASRASGPTPKPAPAPAPAAKPAAPQAAPPGSFTPFAP